jgi:hypothetical protein
MRVDLHKARNQLSISYNEDGTEIVLAFKYADHYDAMLAFDTMAQALQDGMLGIEYRCEPNKLQIGWREVKTG